MARVVVSGYMVRYPLAGNIAAFLQYVIGLSRLGHEVTYIEEKGWEWSCWDPTTGQLEKFPGTGLRLVRSLFAAYCPEVPLVYIDADAGIVDGLSWQDVRHRIARSDVWLDLAGMCWIEERKLAGRRILVDFDPVLTQTGGFGHHLLHEFDVLFTYGTNIGGEQCSAPTADAEWLPTLPPVVLDLWDAPPPSREDPITTITTWRSGAVVDLEGVPHTEKDAEFRRLRALPARVNVPLELAVFGIDEDDRSEFCAAGWRLRDGHEVTRTLASYRAYIASSQAELSAAKPAFVYTRSGWFSDRSACYLAAGRPVIVQDTGFTSWRDREHGIFVFSDVDEAAEALGRVTRNLHAESEAARAIAREHLDYSVVLPPLLSLSPLSMTK